MKKILVLGGPGSGKTSRLISILERAFADGAVPERVAFVSFTKAAIGEASTRTAKKFGFHEARIPYFRTLHSLCYRQLGLRSEQIMDIRKVRAFGKEVGVKVTGFMPVDEAPSIEGDRMMFLIGLAESEKRALREVWEDHGGCTWPALEWMSKSLHLYKKHNGLLDFHDMLSVYVEEGRSVDVDLALVDEAQDLTSLQWAVVERAFPNVKKLYIAGDDDQAIYSWAGADIARFRSLSVDESEVLPVSHRLPKPIFDLAEEISSKIEDRFLKKWTHADHEGSVDWVREIDNLDLLQGNWLLLARNTYLLKMFTDYCQSLGVLYSTRQGGSVDPSDLAVIQDHEAIRKGKTLSPAREEAVRSAVGGGNPNLIWHDAFEGMPLSKRSYYLAMLMSGEKIQRAPRIHIETIHGSKGMEAENVAVITDVAKRSYDERTKHPDSEQRVLYVGMTRAKKNLFLIMPKTILTLDI